MHSLCIWAFFLESETVNQKVPMKKQRFVDATTTYPPTHLPSLWCHYITRTLWAELALTHMCLNMSAPGCSVPRCCVTAVKQSFHTLPLDTARRDQWLNFIFKDRVIPSTLSPRLRVCSSHFANDCFTNLVQVNMGFAKRKILKPGAVPIIYPEYTESITSGVLLVSWNIYQPK